MDQLFWIMLLSLPCLIIPIKHLILLGVAGVALADSRIVSYDFVYYLRFVPMGILCFRILADLKFKKFIPKNFYYWVKVWTPFLMFALMSITYSLRPSFSTQRVLSAGFVLIGFGVGVPLYLETPKKITDILYLVALVMGVAVLYSLYLAPQHESMPAGVQDTERLYGVFRNPNTLGILAMQLVFVLIFFWQKRKEKFIGKFIFGIAVAAGVTLVVTGSRASALGFTVGLLVVIIGYTRVQKKTFSAIWSVLLVLMSISLVAGYFFPEYSGGLFRTDSAGRSFLWDWTWETYKNGPFWGVGYGNSTELFARETLYFRSNGIYAPDAHNSYLSLLLELGVVGLVFGLSGFAMIIIRAWKCLPYFEDPRLGVSLMAAVVASLVNAVFETWVFNFGNASTVPFWLFLGIISYQTAQAQIRIRYASIHMCRSYFPGNAQAQIMKKMERGRPRVLDFKTD